MALPNEIHPFHFAGAGQGYQVPYSLRFRNDGTNGAKLSRTFQTAGNRKTWTWSVWLKLGKQAQADSFLFAYNSGGGYNRTYHELLNGTINFGDYTTGYTWQVATSQVLRDYSAWYHYVVQFDTTQATAANRVRLYLNGSQITTLATASYPSLNYDAYINQAAEHVIASIGYANNSGFDGYMAEMYFIDGYAYDPSYFGQYDSNNVWQPKKYTGTYGTNGFYLPFKTTTTQTSGNLTIYSEDLTNATWTKERSSISSNAIAAPNGTTTADKIVEDTTASNTHRAFFNNLTLTNGVTYTHSVYAKAAGRTAIALEAWNGSTANYCYADLSTGTVIAGSHASSRVVDVGNGWYRCSVNLTGAGLGGSGTALYLMNAATAGYMTYNGDGSSGVYFWGSQVEANSTPGPYYGTVSSSVSATLQIGQDQSNSTTDNSYNNFAASGISLTAGTTYDSMIDSPTSYNDGSNIYNRGNYCTWNPLSSSSGTVAEGNLYYYGSSSWLSKMGTVALPQNSKIYFEATITNAPYTPRGSTSSYNWIGVGLSSNYGISQAPSGGSSSGCLFGDNGYVSNFATAVDVSTTPVNGDVIGVAVDTSTNQYTFYKNNSNVASGIINTSVGTSLSPMQMSYSNSYAAMKTNFGQRPFVYTPPAGYAALNSYNLTNPSLPLV